MKNISAIVTLAASLTAALSGTAFANDFFAQVETKWNVVVKSNYTAAQCAKQIQRKTGFTIGNVLPTVGMLSVTTPTSDGSKLDEVVCVDAIEIDGTATTQVVPSQPEDFFAQVETKWIVVVKDEVSAAQCAKQIQAKTPYTIVNVLPTVGIISLTTPSADSSKLSKISCVSSFELDGIISL